ncbi:hypothetical protein [Pseudomonas fluorescens]|uniref:hypothetical protein n=1 Tax=Pseudomonas fluorescens TaxID=294 RepID=UPI0012414F0E|nr:hypothetical protein [Pseudomonas fluorescens]
MARKAPSMLLQALCYGALEPCRGSQYSPRPPESDLKKTPELKPDQKANLSRHWLGLRDPRSTLNRLLRGSRMGVFLLFFALVKRLPTAKKMTDRMIFTATKKGATPERRF